jgi:hypothetical protein
VKPEYCCRSLTVLSLPSGGEGIAIDFDLFDQKQEKLLVAVGSPRDTHLARACVEVLGLRWVGAQVCKWWKRRSEGG